MSIVNIMDTEVNIENGIMFTAVNETFSEWLQNELRERQLSQAELARQAKVSRGAISHIINGSRQVGTEICEGIARAFKLPPEDVYRIAGLLPAEGKNDTRDNELVYLFKLLPESEKQQVLDYVRYIVDKVEAKKR